MLGNICEVNGFFCSCSQVTRLIPDAKGTTCNQRLERVTGTEHSHILRVPFRSENGILRKWISRFDVWPYLETFAEVNMYTFWYIPIATSAFQYILHLQQYMWDGSFILILNNVNLISRG